MGETLNDMALAGLIAAVEFKATMTEDPSSTWPLILRALTELQHLRAQRAAIAEHLRDGDENGAYLIACEIEKAGEDT